MLVPWALAALTAISALAPRHATPAEVSRGVESPSSGVVEIRVGADLQAIQEVTLDEAVIGRGSHVSVTAKLVQGGTVFFDVALADGHVVKAVPLVAIQKSFRVAG